MGEGQGMPVSADRMWGLGTLLGPVGHWPQLSHCGCRALFLLRAQSPQDQAVD